MLSVLKIHKQPTVLLALVLMAIIIMMVLPVPAFMLDIGLTLSFALAILIFTVTLFIERPLDFSAFPTVLLGSLILRLSLNVSSTKLIIGEGHTGPDAAGSVIHGFAMFVMGGNIFMGLVVFGVILIVNFMVITKGAGRMAEVGARFALDGMPGKQLAIDSDVAAGAISHAEAKERRRIEQEETSFFGSLDGASKFVKGDAVAGLLITILNLIVGLAMGIGVFGLTVTEAVETYSILTVGDGLVSQIPAVIVSVAAAILLSKGAAAGSADKVMMAQLAAHPAAIATVGGIMSAFAFFPGLPFIPFFFSAMSLFAGAYFLHKERVDRALAADNEVGETTLETEKPLGDLIDVDEIHVEFSGDLVPLALDAIDGLEPRIKKIRNYVASEFGFIVPPIRLTDNLDLRAGEYEIKIQGVGAAKSQLSPECILVLTEGPGDAPFNGEDVEEPVYGAPARWIAKSERERAVELGYAVIEPAEVISTHLLETIKSNFDKLVTRRAVRRIFDEYVKTSDQERAAANRRILDEFIPEKLPIDLVQSVFRLLLTEAAPIRNLPVVLEAIAEAKNSVNTPEQITEYVRQRIARNFTHKIMSDDGSLPLIQLSLDWEEIFTAHEVVNESSLVDIALPPHEFNRLADSISEKLKQAASNRLFPAIVTLATRRRFVSTVLRAKGIRNPVFSYDEIDPQSNPALVGVA